MTIQQLKEKVNKEGLPLVLALAGEERAFIDEALVFLRQEALANDTTGLNHHKITIGEQDHSEMMTVLNTLPFLAKQRLVEIHQSEKLTSNEVTALIEYLKNPCPTTILLLLFTKIDKRNKLVNNLINLKFLMEFENPKAQELIKAIIQEAGIHNIKITSQVAHFLALTTQNNLLSAKTELSKLALIFSGQELSIENIEEHLAKSDGDVFLLVRFISEGKLSDALLALNYLRKNQESALKFLGLLAWQFRSLAHIRHCLDRNMAEFDIRKEVGVFGDRFSAMVFVAKKKTIEFHLHRLTRLLECDHALKSLSLKDPFTLIEKIIYQSAVGL